MIAVDSCIRAVWKLLINTGGTWGAVYRVKATETATYPYVLITMTGATGNNMHRHDDAVINLSVKCIDTDESRAMTCAGEIHDRLNDAGVQDIGSVYGTDLDGGANWDIVTATDTRLIYTNQPFSNSADVWHVGAIYRFVMESK